MDCITLARVSKVVCKYFLLGFPDVVFSTSFTCLSSYDIWRNAPCNSNKIVVSTHIMYDYPDEITRSVPKKDSRIESGSLF